MLPYSARDPGSIPTTGAVRTEFVRSPRDHVGFRSGRSGFLPHSNDVRVCRLISLWYNCKMSLVRVGQC